jgi:HPt (histidine-containing phosphotransfer) domain-containing protein
MIAVLKKPVRLADLAPLLAGHLRSEAGLGRRAVLGVLEELVAIDPVGDSALFATFVASFDRDATQRLVELHAALEAGDLAALGSAAHALRGVAATLGASPVQALAARIETQAAAGAGEARPLVDDVARELPLAMAAIAAFAREVATRKA